MIIREATISDVEAMLAIYAPYVKRTAVTFEYEVPTRGDFRRRLQKVQAKYPWIVAEKDGRIVGYAYAGVFKERAAYQWAVETSIYVDDSMKRQGIGRKLHEALERRLKAQGILNMNACISFIEPEDEYLTQDSVRFHEQLGYTEAAHFHRCGKKFGRWYDMIWMEKMIDEQHSHSKQKDVALVLSSGGARGLAHIGAIEELEAQAFRITSVAGCSMGALIGGVYAAGKLQEFREWMRTIDRKKMLELTDFSFSLNHVAKGTRIIEAIMEFVPDVPIENLSIPYCAVATDWKTGREIVFRKGSLFQAIRASISLPSFYEPVQRDGMILIDGGVTNPIPLNRVVRHEGDILVGVDVSGHDYKAQWEMQHELTEKRKHSKSLSQQILNRLRPDSLEFNHYTVLSRVSSIMIRQNSLLMTQLTKPDILIDIQMSRYGSFDYDKSEKLIAIGQKKTQQAIVKYI